ncbi:MAG: hypothetical protein IKQ61_06580 [Spirochaetales bacterium]|nr:hypothetical protein [Spirochaetales bacterium]
MRNFDIFIFIIIIILLLCSCRAVEHKDENPEPGTCGLPKIDYDYNPKAAGAEIVQRIDAPAGLFVTRTNGHYYMISADKITVFDIQNNKMQIIREIPYQLEQLCPNVDKNFLHAAKGIFQINNKIYFGLHTDLRGLRYNAKKELVMVLSALEAGRPVFKGMLSLNDDGNRLEYADITTDLCNDQYFSGMYYDKALQDLIVYDNNILDKTLYHYHYNSQTQHFEQQNEQKLQFRSYSLFITDKYFVSNRFGFRAGYILLNNYLDILLHGETEIHKTIALFKLGIHYPLLSAFSDDKGNIWLYVREYDSETQQDKYELLKLRLPE